MKFPPEFKPVAGRPGWHKSPIGDWQILEATALQLHARFPSPIEVVCGFLDSDTGHATYLIEGASPVDLAREFKTGSHNAFAGVETERVCDELIRVSRVAPFRPYFIDAAGYKAKFLDALSPAQARAIEEILTVGLDGYIAEWAGDGPLLVDILVKENGLRLWWD